MVISFFDMDLMRGSTLLVDESDMGFLHVGAVQQNGTVPVLVSVPEI